MSDFSCTSGFYNPQHATTDLSGKRIKHEWVCIKIGGSPSSTPWKKENGQKTFGWMSANEENTHMRIDTLNLISKVMTHRLA